MPDTTASIEVAALAGRLADAPGVLVHPQVGDAPEPVIAAVLNDVLLGFGHEPLSDQWLQALDARFPTEDPHHRAWQRACGLVAWLVADQQLGPHVPTLDLLKLLGEPLRQLTAHVSVQAMVADDDRREELVRLLLREADIVPAGETREQAADRLATLDTATRLRVIEEARAAEEHSRKVRKALERKRAQEAAAKQMRE